MTLRNSPQETRFQRMIIFKTVAWKNLLSTGNDFTKVELTRSPTTLVVGLNGAGKSSMLDALSFGLFGKPHRGVKKDQLVNSVNNKDCVVIVEFSVGSHEFKVIRGIKPNIFEIHQNGKMIDQTAAIKDYQKYLEQNILKLNHKSFHQIVVLGSSSFIPFMQLSTSQRRGVIEDLLDINIFTKMNIILKEQVAKIKEELKETDHSIILHKEKISLQRKYVKDISDLNEDNLQRAKDKIEASMISIDFVARGLSDPGKYIADNKLPTKDALVDYNEKRETMIGYLAQFKEKMRVIATEARFFDDNENCPTCTQTIEPTLKAGRVDEAKIKAKQLSKVMVDANKNLEEIGEKIRQLDNIQSQIIKYQNRIIIGEREIAILQKSILESELYIAEISGGLGDLQKSRNELESLVDNRDILLDRKFELSDEKTYNEACGEMLKDTGIKTKIIKQYLPVMNKLINGYLQSLDFFVSFNLDESFNEEIKSRYRDKFNYASFSEGEKMKIDLALLFTWRQIAKMKNSASTNLLMLDEVMDSSLDQDGLDGFMKIVNEFDEGTNLFVISHRGDQLDGKFRSKIEFEKIKNFSYIKKGL